jgi:hypothetical protein
MATVNDNDKNNEQVKDHATEHMSPEQVANAAASSLHGDGATREQYVQPAANQLPGDGTLIAASTEAESAKEGTKRASGKN